MFYDAIEKFIKLRYHLMPYIYPWQVLYILMIIRL